ncbi:MAG: NAD(P)-binding protein, partial [Oscillibacter sp.]|nr:NAD(P)-binding protein [Oscillibacter sp.]
MARYDYLIVGAGLFGAVFAREASDAGKRCLVIDRRNHTGGNVHCETVEGIQVHRYGAHIFHTSDRRVWDYVNRFAEFNNYINSPIAVWKDELYNLPFNMNTFSRMWGIRTPAEAQAEIARQIADLHIGEPKNLEEQALKLAGRDIYEKLVKGYTEKQWGRPCTDLPAFIIRRLPLRFTYDNNYFNDRWQGIPMEGYDAIIEKLLDGSEVRLDADFRDVEPGIGDRIVYTGGIDE